MKSDVVSIIVVSCIIAKGQALAIQDGILTVTSTLSAITISSCPPPGMTPSKVALVNSSSMGSIPVYTTVPSKTGPNGFLPVTYMSSGYPSEASSNSASAVVGANSGNGTELAPDPAASASSHLQSGDFPPLYVVPTAAVSSDFMAPSGGSSSGVGASNAGDSSVNGTGTDGSNAGNSGDGGSNAGGLGIGGSVIGPSGTRPTRSSNGTVSATTSGMTLFTGGANAGRLSGSNVGAMMAVLLAGVVLL